VSATPIEAAVGLMTRADVMLSEIESKKGRPLRAMIEISDRCNEVCVHCYQEQGQKGEMTTAEIKAVIDELAELGVLVLTISGGEATLRSDFLELCAHARSRGFALRIFTNGLTMTAELAHALGELAVHVVEISLYSHRAEAHDAITGVAGSFERTVAGIRHLVREGVDVHVKTPIMSINEDELPEYTAFANSLGASFGLDPTALLPREARDREPERLTRSMEAVARVLSDPQLGGTPVEAESAESSPERDLSSSICGAGHYVLVEPNGVIRPCTMLHVDLGHAQEGIGNAREGNTVLDGLRGLTWADVHGCRECDLRGDCQRCHAASLAEVGFVGQRFLVG
jgi:radical SAM protein with 4Fe4S-binding SPASM domain